jgi:hypothetical protein
MQRLFQTFDRHAVRYLLIRGQAAILYGAANFSEAVDVWIDPGARNVAAFLRSLAAVDATVYKLTPPMTRRNVAFGHAFHFLVPDGGAPLFLDVMPRPPRVGTFAASHRRCRRMAAPIGEIDVVSIEDLIELKKTRRLADYDVITNLVAIRLREVDRPDLTLIRWAAQNAFRAADRSAYLRLPGKKRSHAVCQRELLRDVSRLQKADTAHWSKVIDDLRLLRSRDALLAESTPVRTLVTD